jgi:RNA polymerase sigma factor (sigma-70 family)
VSDQELLASLKRGNDHAFSLLVNKYKDMVFSICLKITEDFHQAEEVAQDTFMKIYQQHSRFEGRSKFSSWLYKIAINTSYNKIKQRKPLDSLEEFDEQSFLGVESGIGLLAREDRQRCIHLALGQLEKMDALILTLFYLEDQNIEVLAEITELSKVNIKVRLHRGRKKLAAIITQHLGKEIDSL